MAKFQLYMQRIEPSEYYEIAIVTQLSGTKIVEVLAEGKGQGTLEPRHCQNREISLRLINSPDIQLRHQKSAH